MRPFTVLGMDQRTDDWRQARLGRLTGSRAGDMLATIKSGEAAGRRNYRIELVCERLTGRAEEDRFVSKEMQRGIELEGSAFVAYEALTGRVVRRTGFIRHDALMVGCSLDGDVDDLTGVVELKCPNSATHLRYLRSDAVPSEHLPQLWHGLWVTGAEWVDFVSFDDRFPLELQLVRRRLTRDATDMANYEKLALIFLAEVDREYEAVATLANCGRQLSASLAAVNA